MSWTIKYLKKLKLKNPILIEGLPGVGNVGKIAADFMIEELKAKKVAEIRGDNLPHTVFVGEDNLIELPAIELYHAKNSKRDILLLAGDAQPNDEKSCYEFCDLLLDAIEQYSGNEIITLAGIALKQEPENPQVFITGNDKNLVKKYSKGTKVNKNLYGSVGPIIGVSGLLLGLAKRRNIPAVSLLAETLGHPLYIGIGGAREILEVLKKKLNVKLDLELLDKEIEELETEVGNKTKEIKARLLRRGQVNYIG